MIMGTDVMSMRDIKYLEYLITVVVRWFGREANTSALGLTCRLLFRRRGLQRRLFRLQLDEQSKKLQSSSLLQFWSRMSLILGSKKAMSTSMATTCRRAQP